ncbi:MAG: hypothetical protein ACI8UO_001653 [Verrucomicrobiales bacterium]|jgi:hypothetical protein
MQIIRPSNLISVVAVFIASIGLAFAQEKPAAKDPFKKNIARQAPKPDAENVQRMVVLGVEFIQTPKAEADRWSADSKLSDDEIRSEVEALIKAGEAQVIESTILQARSGQRVKIESVLELIYPTAHSVLDIDPKGPTFPKAFEIRNCGLTLEVDPVIGADLSTINLNILVERTKYLRENIRDPRDNIRVFATDVIDPLIGQQKVVTSINVQPEEYNLLAQFEPFDSDKAKTERILLFLRVGIQLVAPTKLTEALPDSLNFRFEWIELNAPDWHAWLAGEKLADVPTSAWPAVRQLLKENKADSHEMLVARAQSGQRMKTGSTVEHIYASEIKEPKVVGGACEPLAQEARLSGYMLEIDPVAGAQGALYDLNYNPEWVTRGRDFVSYRKESPNAGQAWIPAVTMPLFHTNRLTASNVLAGGTTQLIGVFSPPKSDGSGDLSKKVLLFVHDDTIPRVK